MRSTQFVSIKQVCALREEGRLRTSDGILILYSRSVKTNILDWGLLTTIIKCEADLG